MKFEDIKKIVDKEGKVIILENEKAYIVSRYIMDEAKEETKEVVVDEAKQVPTEKKEGGLKIEDLPF